MISKNNKIIKLASMITLVILLSSTTYSIQSWDTIKDLRKQLSSTGYKQVNPNKFTSKTDTITILGAHKIKLALIKKARSFRPILNQVFRRKNSYYLNCVIKEKIVLNTEFEIIIENNISDLECEGKKSFFPYRTK